MTYPTSNPSPNKLPDTIAEHEERLSRLEAGQRTSQLGNSSIEDDYVAAYDALGQARQRIGRQNDGTFAISYANGPVPPTPSGLNVAAGQLALIVQWDGTFAGNVARPGDIERLDIHMSETNGFTFSPVTAVQSMKFAGAVTFFADSDTKYIRIVAVNSSSVPSAPTAQITILPLPADQIAAGAIGAQQLAAVIALFTTVHVGSPTAGHITLDGVGNNFFVFKPDGVTKTLTIDGDTGDVVVTGVYKTAVSGERIEILSSVGLSYLRFYSATSGTNHAAIYRTGDQIVMRGQEASGKAGYCFLGPTQAALSYGQAGVTQQALIMADTNFVRIQAAVPFLRSDHRFASDGDGVQWRCAVLHNNTSGVDIGNSVLEFRTKGVDNEPWIKAPVRNSGLVFGVAYLHVSDAAGNYAGIAASAFTVGSGRALKDRIEPIPFDSVQVVKNAKSSMWEYPTDRIRAAKPDVTLSGATKEHPNFQPEWTSPSPQPKKHFGPMAEDVPEQMRRVVNETGEPHLDLGDMIGVLWDAVGKLSTELDATKSRLTIAESKLPKTP